MIERRERRTRCVQRGRYAVRVEIAVDSPEESPDDPCLEPQTVKWLGEVAKRAEDGDMSILRSAGRVSVEVEE